MQEKGRRKKEEEKRGEKRRQEEEEEEEDEQDNDDEKIDTHTRQTRCQYKFTYYILCLSYIHSISYAFKSLSQAFFVESYSVLARPPIIELTPSQLQLCQTAKFQFTHQVTVGKHKYYTTKQTACIHIYLQHSAQLVYLVKSLKKYSYIAVQTAYSNIN